MFTQSIIPVKDNSGLKYIKIIKLLGNSSFKKQLELGDVVVTSVFEKKKNADSIKKIVKKKINLCLIISSKLNYLKKDGANLKYDISSCIFYNSEIKNLDISDKKKKINLKVFMPISRDLFFKDYQQVVYYATKTVY
jgi:ribosomal protein L14